MRSFEFTAAQESARDVLAGGQRHTLGVGGARSGKTFAFVHAIMVRALRFRSRHAILRFRYNAVRSTVWLDTLPKVCRLCFPGLQLVDHRQDGYVELPNGSEIWFGGLDEKERVEKILGQEHATIYFNECSQIPYESVVIALTRLAQQCPGLTNRAYYDLNPTTTRHWSHALFFDGRDPLSKVAVSNPEDYANFRLNPRDNVANIDPAFLSSLEQLPERQRKRFLDGVYGAAIDGALWPPEVIDACRRDLADVGELTRVVIGVDPSGASGADDIKADAIGIVAAGKGKDGHGNVLEDATDRLSPEGWARKVIGLYHKHAADRIVAEKNYGGDMVRAVIHSIDRRVPVELVNASRGKSVRAEPVSTLYAQGLVHHVGRFLQLEDEMESFSTAGYLGATSPNRADALVWALTDLMLNGASRPWIVPLGARA